MNNSFFAIERSTLDPEESFDNKPVLREREAKLVKILDAIAVISSTKEWSSLKEEIFDGLNDRLSKDLLAESKKENPDALRLNRLTGQLLWAERYSDLTKLDQMFRSELINVRTQLYGKTKE